MKLKYNSIFLKGKEYEKCQKYIKDNHLDEK